MRSPDEIRVTGLSDDDALSLWVGRVARAHARLEYGVDNVRRFLARREGELPQKSGVTSFDQLTRECRKRLQQSKVDRSIVVAGDAALVAARQVTAERNRVVHDMWLPAESVDDSDEARWHTFRRSGDFGESYNLASARELASIVEVHTLLIRTQVRVSGLFMALHAIWPEDSPEPQPLAGDAVARYVAMMKDRFTLLANGDIDTT